MVEVDYDSSLPNFLDKLDDYADRILQTYASAVKQSTDEVESKEFAQWIVASLGGLKFIGPKHSIDGAAECCLVPTTKLDGDASFFNTEAKPLLGAVVPMIPNPDLCPAAAKRFAARKGAVIASGGSSLQHDESMSDSDFEIDTCGGQSSVLQPLESFKSTSKQLRSDRLTNMEVNNQADLTEMLKNAAGISLYSEVVGQSKVPKEQFRSFRDITTKSVGFIDKACIPRTAPIIREVVEADGSEKHDLNDTKVRKVREKLRRSNELDAFYGMKRQSITPEMRQEFQAINLRAYANPQAHYRGAKRGFDLAEADSGFFEIGHVVSGGLHDQPLNADGSTIITERGKKRKTKSLVKELLINK